MSEDLLLYAQLGRADHIKRLVGEGADPDWRREDGVTTLMMAAMTGRIEVMDALLDVGSDIDLQASDGTNALLAACTFARTTRDIAGIEALLVRGADPKRANAEGNDPLMMAARHGLVEAVIALLKAGADPRHQNRYGTTALMQAARGHLVETCRLLIRAGADRSQRDERGLTAARYAQEVGTPPMELSAMLAPGELGGPSDFGRRVCRFDKPDFKISLLGSWNESETEEGFEYLETTGERQIVVSTTSLPAELDVDEIHDAISRRVREHQASIAREAARQSDDGGNEPRFSEVRVAEAADAIQARFNAVSPAGSIGELFVAVCVYAAPSKFVTLSYRDFRPNLSEEARGRQASESVASFRVK